MVEDDNWNRIIDNKLRPYRFLIRVGNFFAVILNILVILAHRMNKDRKFWPRCFVRIHDELKCLRQDDINYSNNATK